LPAPPTGPSAQHGASVIGDPGAAGKTLTAVHRLKPVRRVKGHCSLPDFLELLIGIVCGLGRHLLHQKVFRDSEFITMCRYRGPRVTLKMRFERFV
jgi:hypothetical protein